MNELYILASSRLSVNTGELVVGLFDVSYVERAVMTAKRPRARIALSSVEQPS